ncbi:MAG: class I SAM-dependent methyltransferase [Deltaproteobacteria bacterium]|nr:MAG: class I SAM-dependent methyltransferase [Deltaproteobacteria bacterium]
MPKKGNRVENWNVSYEQLGTTYRESIEDIGDLVNNLQYEFVLEDIVRFLPSSREGKVLEVGCGGARTSLYLANRGFDVTCSDYAPEAIRLAKDNFAAHGARGKFVQDDLLHSILPAESFDCVMSFGLLEHFEDIRQVIGCITKLVKPGGIQIHCIITKKFSTQTLVNVLFYPYRFAKDLLRGNFRGIFRRSYRDFPHYENTFSAWEYCRAFREEGNEVLRCEAGGILFPFISLSTGVGKAFLRAFPVSLPRLIRVTDRTENRVMHILSPTFYIVCRKQG